MFTDAMARLIVDAAKTNDIKPSCLLALIEVETKGKPFEEADGHTPAFLYERHIAYKEAGKRNKLKQYIAAGLAIPKWSRATQYKDQRKSADRLALIHKARGIDTETANRSASWGVGQIMGFNAEWIGYVNATDMVEQMTGSIQGQIKALIKFLQKKHIITPLNAKNWARVAELFNGSGYKQNAYDTKLADAEKRWARKWELISSRETPPEQKLTKGAVMGIQEKLRELGYLEAGRADGVWGTKTVAAVSAFQAHEGLPVTGQYDDATKNALDVANPRPVSKEREEVTVEDLKPESRTIQAAEKVSIFGRIKLWLGGLFGGGVAADKSGLLDQAQDAADKAQQVSSVWTTFHDFFSSNTTLLIIAALIGSGLLVWYFAEKIKGYRVEDHATGAHA